MHRTPLRIGLLVLAMLVTAGLGIRAYEDEHQLSAARAESARLSGVAAQAFEKLADLRASLHAYVAPGQDIAFWTKRAQATLDALRQDLTTLNAAAAPVGSSLSASLKAVDQLAAAERRARTYVGRDEALLAGDVIFTEVRDLLASTTTQIDTATTTLDREFNRRVTAAIDEQRMLAAGALGAWILVALLLVPPSSKPAMADPGEWRHELKATLQKPATAVAAEPIPVPEPAPAPAPEPIPVVPVMIEPGVKVGIVQQVAEICADLSSLSDPDALEGALERVNAVLDATGLIIWAASSDSGALVPVAVQGFDPALVARIGYIPRDAANVTAAAFRENTPKINAPTDTTPGAIAVAMCGPSGPSGVFSIEFKLGEPVDEAKIAVASIIAAQLATLAMPVPQAVAAGKDLKRAI